MKLYSRMYVRGIPDNKVMRIMRRMNKGKEIDDLYCITLPVFQDGILEIYAYEQLTKPPYTELEHPVIVIGITKTEADAKELVTLIVDEVYQNTGGFAVGEYLKLH